MSTSPYTFDYADVDENGEIVTVHVEFSPGTVRTNMEEARIRRKLLLAYGHVAGNPAPDDVFGNMAEYAAVMARTKASAPWWANSNMPEEAVRAAFERFLDMDAELWEAFRVAVSATAAPKKTMTKTPPTSS